MMHQGQVATDRSPNWERGLRLVLLLVVLVFGAAYAGAAEMPAAEQSDWLDAAASRIEAEAAADLSSLPEVGAALARQWRSLDHDGSAGGTLVDIGLVAIAALAALAVERGIAAGLARSPRRRLQQRIGRPTAADMTLLVLCDLAGLFGFVALFYAARRFAMPTLGITELLGALAAGALLRWRVAALVVRAILRPEDPVARLVDIATDDARRLNRFISLAALAVIVLIAFARIGLAGDNVAATHVIGLFVAIIVCALYMTLVIRARRVGEALIRGRRGTGIIATVRNGLARAWVPGGLVLVAGLFLIFVAGLSLGLLAYYRAVSATLGVLLVVLVLDGLAERVWYDDAPPAGSRPASPASLTSRAMQRLAVGLVAVIAALMIASIWIGAIEPNEAAASSAMRSATTAIVTLFAAFVVWELVRLAIDRNLQSATATTAGVDEDDEAVTPATRLQTVLPLLRAAIAVLIGIVAVLTVLSRLGVDTAPLIAGAGVFGLAVSFGSQSLVRDIISGVFYMWDDAFRAGEYIDTGRLKGTVEALGIRSVRLRHQNGPLHTIPYGQLGAVTNLSRDFATIKFNLRFDPRTDIELVRRTTKRIGLAMIEENEEMAAEVMAPLKLQGIAEVVDSALVLRFKFTARPVKPSWVQREYMKRMYQVFAEKGIAFATGTLTLQTVAVPDGGAPALPAAQAPAPGRDVPALQGAVVALAAGAVAAGALDTPASSASVPAA
jgi:small-conductance mechanosensitive channel